MRVFVDTNLTSGESVMLLVPGSTTVEELKVGIEVLVGWEVEDSPNRGVGGRLSSSSRSWSWSWSTC